MRVVGLSIFIVMMHLNHLTARGLVLTRRARHLLSIDASALRAASSTSLAAQEMPVTPVSFGEKFQIQEMNEKMGLEIANGHELDNKIKFEEGPHEYFWDGIKLGSSVTRLVESFFEKFDPDDAIQKMKNGSKWPRPEYTRKSGEVWTDEQIKLFWDGVGLYARNRGTWMHYNIERFLNGLQPSQECPEMEYFHRFNSEVMEAEKIEPYRTEWRICAPEYDLAGSVDFVGKRPDGTYVIMDWKRSKNLASSLENSFGKRAKAPLQHIDDTDASKYFLQLNIYRYILQKHYGIKISQMVLASFHPATEKYFHVSVPIWEEEVEAALRHHYSKSDAKAIAEAVSRNVVRSSPKAITKPKMTPIKSPFADAN